MNTMLFKYPDPEKEVKELHTVEINGEPWFFATDVCELLDLTNVSQALSKLDDDEKSYIILNDVSNGTPKRHLVNESGLYGLILSSRKPSAKAFRKWVTKEVIPSIRKTGSYSSVPQKESLPAFVKRYLGNLSNVKRGYFSVITELYVRLYSELELYGYVIPDKARDGKMLCPDISVGKHFSTYLLTKRSPYVNSRRPYNHHYEDGRIVQAFQYPNAVLPEFIEFMFDYWIPNCAEEYFKKRDGRALNYLPKLLSAKAS